MTSEVSPSLERILQNGNPTLSLPLYEYIESTKTWTSGTRLHTAVLLSNLTVRSPATGTLKDIFPETPLRDVSLSSVQQSSPIINSKHQQNHENHSDRYDKKKSYSSIISKNRYPCSYGCTTTNGKLKRFRRKEHQTRHERTIHEAVQLLTCWVSECTDTLFTRADNLQSHYDRHGRGSSPQKLRYVATLDRTSAYYNPDWRGELTEEGYPI